MYTSIRNNIVLLYTHVHVVHTYTQCQTIPASNFLFSAKKRIRKAIQEQHIFFLQAKTVLVQKHTWLSLPPTTTPFNRTQLPSFMYLLCPFSNFLPFFLFLIHPYGAQVHSTQNLIKSGLHKKHTKQSNIFLLFVS